MGRKVTKEEFIERANKTHNNKYNYDLAEYINTQIKVKITCLIHGVFEQIPAVHMIGQGCFKCGLERIIIKQKLTLEEFIEKSKKIHCDRYIYDDVIYINNRTDVNIFCSVHGLFKQTPGAHMSGKGCQKCGGSFNLTTEDFINRATEIHNNKYCYDLVEYKNTKTGVKIICPIHGEFKQTPLHHLSGKGCMSCGGRKKLTTEEFIKRADKVHNNKYNYDLVEYKNIDSKVKILCLAHGIFEQTPYKHLQGQECSKCTNSVSRREIKWLNSLNIKERQFKLKIGDKNFNVDGYDPDTNTIYEFYGDYWHGNPEYFLPNDINRDSKFSFGFLYQRTIDRELELKAAGYNVISIWESEFLEQNNCPNRYKKLKDKIKDDK
jgi:hypothetical protein